MSRLRQAAGVEAAPRRHEVVGILALAGALFLALALLTYHPMDPSLNTASTEARVRNAAGPVGAYLADGIFQILGGAGFLLPLYALVYGANRFRLRQEPPRRWATGAGALALLVALASLLSLLRISVWETEVPGGVLGHALADFLVRYVSVPGAYLVVLTVGLVAMLVSTKLSVLSLLEAIRHGAVSLWESLLNRVALWQERSRKARERRGLPGKPREERGTEQASPVSPRIVSPGTSPAKASGAQVELPFVERTPADTAGPYQIPPVTLLAAPPKRRPAVSHEALMEQSQLLVSKLRDFGVEGRVTQVYPGPVVTLFEFEPAPGVKISRVATLAEDLALAMRALSVRVMGQIPGKAAVGIEVSNPERETVTLQEILTSPAYRDARLRLPLALGKDIFGNPVVADLEKMPHILVAGATGSGKSMALNAMVVSLLYRATPEELRFVLVDPKRLELSVYADIPHLLTPVVTEPKQAAETLKGLVAEMERRYRLLAEEGVRNVEAYNARMRRKAHAVAPRDEAAETQPPDERLPYVVVIVDELADLMMASAREVEDAIARLAQMARASGIHLVLATQRPSVDVLTGLIKANFPARIAFQVSSKTDSRTILDANGAEQLLGQGDMLFLAPGTHRLTRIHAPFLSEEEIARVVAFVRRQGQPQYGLLEQVRSQQAAAVAGDSERDELYQRAVELVVATRQASISYIQRRLRVGYNRAARIIEMMEEDGIVGPPQEAGKPREVLVPKTQ